LVALSNGSAAPIARTTQLAAFAILALAFAVKSPLWPLHSWLPDAHTEAPTVGSVLLAGVLLKLGTYGLIRVAVPVLPEGARAFAPGLGVLASLAIVVGALCCLVQTDLKRLIAYSSVGHMGFVLLGIASLTATGIQAALIGNLAHGLITGLLFFLAGAIKDRHHTGRLDQLGGLGSRAPVLAGLFGFAAVASLGLPGLAGFWGELFAVVASWQRGASSGPLWTVCAVVAAVGGAMAAAYFLRLLRQVVSGERGVAADLVSVEVAAEMPPASVSQFPEAPLSVPPLSVPPLSVPPLSVTEWLSWAPLVVLTLVVGLLPNVVLSLSQAPVEAIVAVVGW
jgi:NADH-quinone oxidoreductase subunit M